MTHTILEIIYTICFYIFTTYTVVFVKHHDLDNTTEILKLMLFISAAYQSHRLLKIHRNLAKHNHNHETDID